MQISYNAYNFVDRVDNLDGNMLADYIWMADGSRYRVSSSSGHGLTYRGSFTYRTDSSGAESLESIMTDDGRIIPVFSGEEEDYIYMHYTSDALGNVLTVSDTSGNIMDQNIYSLFGKRINTPDMIEDPDNRFRFSGKEEQAFAGLPYIDFGARMYDPASSRWTSPDPLAHKYFSSSPYVFCGNNPVNIIDPDGKSWYFNSETGEFVSHIEDDDDYVYLITPEQIDKVNNGDKELQSYQTESNMFGQILLEGIYDESVTKAIILYFLERATWKDESGQEKYVDYPISINLERQDPPASILKSEHKLNINTSSGYYYKGYDIILLLSHEVGHLVDNSFKIYSSKLPLKRLIEIERYADEFARRHWSYGKASDSGKSRIDEHYKNPAPFL